MIKLLSFAILCGLVFGENCTYPTHIRCWTDWFNSDDPSGAGDYERLPRIITENPGKICLKPVDIQARTQPGVEKDVIHQKDAESGFICRNQDQVNKMEKKCNDYRVRFSCHPPFCGGGVCWTKWFNRDRPTGTGDWEVLEPLRAENPGDICDDALYIEVVTADTLTPAISTGEIFHAYNPSYGFACRKKDQKSGYCRDYKVRFGCPCEN
ncbi:uncharacterized protein [Brachyistius frenatus]|uniref:uncharacterized protein n=1 Tax=Brachyistius frenatus TaxID=100188 RepID=UPI0037E8F86E